MRWAAAAAPWILASGQALAQSQAPIRIGEINSQFHHALQDAAGSPRLKRALSALIEAPLVMKTFHKYTTGDLIRSAQHHLELCSALEVHDPEWAASVMSSHVHAARGALRR